MKKILILSVLFFLFSCSWSSDDTSLQSYNWEFFSVKIPTNWVILNENDSVLPSPSVGDIALSIASPDMVNGFSNNMLIIQDDLDYVITSWDFSQMNNDSSKNSYEEYVPLSEKELKFDDGEKSKLFTFHAKYNTKTPTLTFLQTARICEWKKSFFLTLALPMDIKETARYEEMLSTFECKG